MSTTRHDPTQQTSSSPGATGGLKAMDFAEKSNWPGYFQAVLGKPARETLVTALELFDQERGENGPARDAAPGPAPAPGEAGFAVDLAAGEGRDSLELLRRGWTVLAIEMLPEGIALLRNRVEPARRSRLHTQVADFAGAWWPVCDLVNCSFALPFCRAEEFDSLWAKIVGSIRVGGRFAGQLFGDRDTWARCGRTTGVTRARVLELFAPFELEQLREEEKDDVTSMGEAKHWHVFHLVSRRR